jgi:transcriptional regulator with XRE-family HTH domain
MAKDAKGGLKLRQILAQNLLTYRKQKQLSQEDLAQVCGLHRTYIGSVERCERNVTLSTLETLSAALDVSVPDLLTEREHND